MSELVTLEISESIATVTLNRPEKLNAWTEQMRQQLIEHLESLAERQDVRVVILTGTGAGFCAGQDLAETRSMDPNDHEAAESWIDGFDRLYHAVRDLDQITIAAVNGVAAGSGFQFSLLADLRVGDSSSRMGQPEVKSGIPSITGIWAMWDILGKSKTSEFTLTGELVSAAEAHRLGLLNYLVEDGQVMEHSRKLADKLSELPPGAVRMTKRRLRSLDELALIESVKAAKDVHREAYASGEPQREMARFLSARGN